MSRIVIFGLIFILCILKKPTWGINKYSEAANRPKNEFTKPHNVQFMRELDKPFRMHKLNLVWTKAKHRLSDPKLQSIFSDLKIQDKEEIAYKHYLKDHKDSDGLEEARLRKKLKNIMSSYDLLEHFDETVDPDLHKVYKFKDPSNIIAKNVFKDKRLNDLWAKAERAGFSHNELETLKEEFTHHQEKVDEYMNLLEEVENGDQNSHENSIHEELGRLNEVEHEDEPSNEIPGKKSTDYLHKANLLKDKRFELKNGYDHLDRITARGADNKEFIEPKVQGLWKLALDAGFKGPELESLKEELVHYQTRLLKVRELHTHAALEAVRQGKLSEPVKSMNSKDEAFIKKESLHINKLHTDLENKILQRHSEL